MTITNEAPSISVILATRADKIELLRNCLKSLESQKFRDFEIIIVAKKFPPEIQYMLQTGEVRFVEEKGSTLGAARNIGVNNAKGKLISFIDDDAEASPDWLEKINSTFVQFPSISCLGGPHFTLQDKSEKSQSKPLDFVEGLFFEGHSQITYFDKFAIGKIAGCNVTYTKSIFEELGCLNERLRTCEDWDLNARLIEKGYTIRFDPQIWVWHRRQGLSHAFKGSSKSAPFFLSWRTIKLARYEPIIASFYASNLLFILLIATLFFSLYATLILFAASLLAYVTFNAVRTHTYNRKIFYFPLVVFLTAARILGFYFGLIKHANFKLHVLFSR